MASPYDKAPTSIGVTVVTSGPLPPPADDVAVLRLEPALHQHPAGAECVACAALADVRAMLFDLLASARAGGRSQFGSVVIDATRIADPQPILARLDPKSPAVGMRDFTVARSFHLAAVI